MGDFKATAMSGSLTRLTDGTSAIIAGSNITIVSGSGGGITITSSGGGSSEWTLNSTNLYPNSHATTTVLVGGNNPSAADILLGAGGGAIFNEQGDAQDFRVETANRENALIVKGATDQFLIMSGGAAASPHEAGGLDVSFYVSGSSTGRSYTLSRGVALLGGDTVISGSLTVFNSGSDAGGTISGSIHHTSGGLSYIVGGSEITVASSSNGQITISSNAGPQEWTDEGSLLRPFDSSGVKNIGIGGTGNALGEYLASIHGTTGNIHSNYYITASMGFSGSLTRLTNDTSYLVAGANITIASESNGQVTITGTGAGAEWTDETDILRPADGAGESVGIGATGNTSTSYPIFLSYDGGAIFNQTGGNVNFIVETAGEANALKINGSGNSLTINEGETAFVTSIRNANDTAIEVTADGVTFNQDGHPTNDFRVESNTKQGAFIVDSGADVIMMGTTSTSISGEIVPVGSDVSLYMSGTSGSMGGTSKGSTLVAGDLLVSGTVVLGGKRQSNPIEGHALEVSGSSRAGAGFSGRLEYLYGSFTYDMSNPRPRFLPLAKSHENLSFTTGNSGSMASSLSFPHDATIREMRLTLSGASGNTNNPGNSQIAFYTSTGLTANVDSIHQASSTLTFAAAPTGFVRSLSPTISILNDDGQTWMIDLGGVNVNKDRVMLLAIGFTTGPNTGKLFHGSYTVIFEYNEFS